MRWEYLNETYWKPNGNMLSTLLNYFGEMGWEVIDVLHTPDADHFLFKRQL